MSLSVFGKGKAAQALRVLAAAGLSAALWTVLAPPSAAQTTPQNTGGAVTQGTAIPAPPVEATKGALFLSAHFASGAQPIRSGLVWRVFEEQAQPDGSHRLAGESAQAAPALNLPEGAYIVHAAYGLASATKRVVIGPAPVTERLTLNAGALRITGTLGDTPIAPHKVSIAVFVPEPGNAEAKLVVSGARPGDVIRLPEGAYHIVSTYLDTVSQPSQNTTQKPAEPLPPGMPPNATNSIVTADLRVPSGKLIDATLRHKAATMTLKLVSQPGGEALANTSFTVMTPGGDVIREMIGAFPSLVLAEGEYKAYARHADKVYEATFDVKSALDRDVEVIAR